jgi:hypothetical protein
MVLLPPGVLVEVESVNVEVAAAVPEIGTGFGLKAQAGAVLPLTLAQERLTLPV